MFYVYNVRFQPLTKLNEQELTWLINSIGEDDQIIIGIVNPMPTFIDANDNAETWVRFKLEYNPLSYWERYYQIKSFIDKSDFSNKVYAIVPLPRPSKNMIGAANYLPTKENRVICLPIVHDSEQEEEKLEGLRKQGEEPLIIPSEKFGGELTLISPELIFCLIAIGSDGWMRFVNDDVKQNLIDMNIEKRLFERGLNKEKALAKLKQIYKRTYLSTEVDILYQILHPYLTEIAKPKEIIEEIEIRNQNADKLAKRIEGLASEIEDELPVLRKNAPIQYEVFKEIHSCLYEFQKSLCGQLTEEQIKKIETTLEGYYEQWQQRNR